MITRSSLQYSKKRKLTYVQKSTTLCLLSHMKPNNLPKASNTAYNSVCTDSPNSHHHAKRPCAFVTRRYIFRTRAETARGVVQATLWLRNQKVTPIKKRPFHNHYLQQENIALRVHCNSKPGSEMKWREINPCIQFQVHFYLYKANLVLRVSCFYINNSNINNYFQSIKTLLPI